MVPLDVGDGNMSTRQTTWSPGPLPSTRLEIAVLSPRILERWPAQPSWYRNLVQKPFTDVNSGVDNYPMDE